MPEQSNTEGVMNERKQRNDRGEPRVPFLNLDPALGWERGRNGGLKSGSSEVLIETITIAAESRRPKPRRGLPHGPRGLFALAVVVATGALVGPAQAMAGDSRASTVRPVLGVPGFMDYTDDACMGLRTAPGIQDRDAEI
jgi:hypothetical protein